MKRRILVVAALLAGCGGEKTDEGSDLGNLTLMVEAPTALPVPKVDYAITRKGRNQTIVGAIRVDGLTRLIAANVRGLSPGSGYEVALKASSLDGDVSCSGQGSFEVVARQTTQVTTGLTCSSRSGSPVEGVPRNYCPLVSKTKIAPTQAVVGSSVMLGVEAGGGDGGVMGYTWSGAGGHFGDASASDTSFTCDVEGDHVLTVLVTNGACADRALLTVRCTAQPCGNGRIDPGETCDDGNRSEGDKCPADCLLPSCGNGKLEANETCEPPGTASCDSQCRKPIGCGNGLVDAGEDCDDGNRAAMDGCAPDCRFEALCGNGVVEPGEECEPPGVGTCGPLCKPGTQ